MGKAISIRGERCEVHLVVPSALKRRIAVLAASRGQSISDLCVPLLQSLIDDLYKKIDLKAEELPVNGKRRSAAKV